MVNKISSNCSSGYDLRPKVNPSVMRPEQANQACSGVYRVT
ncbi:uncharacterized protein PgNI_00382 [Pyricularia grisea]|uniref:Uncharacterized protein n=1 Tax=Pyricularia grisea TaxID=148305 RepID=A0A6P8BLP4_PYRGI|nr:uncharacterized protein PgNI_00382 [Pyricularia grisea]TLD17738.1 hypothetical protein PgNI_00382 [Pyricularia grisea]